MGDRSEDDIQTHMITRAQWIPPVKRQQDLPATGVENGTLCLVEGEISDDEEVFEFRDGRWHPLA